MLNVQHSQISFNSINKKNDLATKLTNAKITPNIETFSLNYSPEEIERMKLCGILFDRRSSVRKEFIDEFFRKEPCLYDQYTYKYAARIFNCLKVDLNENPLLKSLRQEEEKNDDNHNKIAEVPRINYKNNQEKKNTFKLAFSVLRFQKLLEQLFDECQFYAKYPDSKDEQSLACTILFDYMMRKFQLRELSENELAERDTLVALIETYIYQEKTHLAAALARNRIKSDALSVEELLPIELREVEQHKAELPLYCWINPIKTDLDTIIQHFTNDECLKLVSGKENLDHKCFMIDPHCGNLLTFHYTLRNRIQNHDYVKEFKLIIQDKSSCLAPLTVQKLLSKNDDVILTDVGGGLLAGYLGCIMKEFEGRVFAFGATTEEKYEEITQKMKLIGCSKYVKVMREKFPDDNEKLDEKIIEKLLNVKVILINAPCSKTALMNPMEFLFQEGADIRLLRDFSIDYKNQKRILNAIEKEKKLMNYALCFPYVRAIVYQTYSKNKEENEEIIQKALNSFNTSKKTNLFPYKLSPPVIPITMSDLQNDEIVKGVKYLQFKPSNKMNGCFVALLSRDKDAKVDKELKKEYAMKAKKAREAALAAAAAEDEAEIATNNSINKNIEDESTKKKSSKKGLSKKKNSTVKKPSTALKAPTIEEQITKLQIKEATKSQEAIDKAPMTYLSSLGSLESKLAQIGKLSQPIEINNQNRNNDLDDGYDQNDEPKEYTNQPIHMKQYEFNIKKSVDNVQTNEDNNFQQLDNLKNVLPTPVENLDIEVHQLNNKIKFENRKVTFNENLISEAKTENYEYSNKLDNNEITVNNTYNNEKISNTENQVLENYSHKNSIKVVETSNKLPEIKIEEKSNKKINNNNFNKNTIINKNYIDSNGDYTFLKNIKQSKWEPNISFIHPVPLSTHAFNQLNRRRLSNINEENIERRRMSSIYEGKYQTVSNNTININKIKSYNIVEEDKIQQEETSSYRSIEHPRYNTPIHDSSKGNLNKDLNKKLKATKIFYYSVKPKSISESREFFPITEINLEFMSADANKTFKKKVRNNLPLITKNKKSKSTVTRKKNHVDTSFLELQINNTKL